MRRTLSAGLAAAVAMLIWLEADAGGQGSPVPRLGTGAVTIEGDVNVKGNVRVIDEAAVTARQSGPWRVGIEGQVATAPQDLSFVKSGRAYEIRWPGQPAESIVAREVHGPWVRVEEGARGRTRSRWINLLAAQSIVEQ